MNNNNLNNDINELNKKILYDIEENKKNINDECEHNEECKHEKDEYEELNEASQDACKHEDDDEYDEENEEYEEEYEEDKIETIYYDYDKCIDDFDNIIDYLEDLCDYVNDTLKEFNGYVDYRYEKERFYPITGAIEDIRQTINDYIFHSDLYSTYNCSYNELELCVDIFELAEKINKNYKYNNDFNNIDFNKYKYNNNNNNNNVDLFKLIEYSKKLYNNNLTRIYEDMNSFDIFKILIKNIISTDFKFKSNKDILLDLIEYKNFDNENKIIEMIENFFNEINKINYNKNNNKRKLKL